MSRISVIQNLIDCFKQANYLEVGVEDGFTFHAVRANRRVAVDPVFRFQMPTNPVTDTLEYHQITSDAYFGMRKPSDTKFDVIFLDGLHTFEQILRDLLNATECLSDNGVIVVDDIWPTSYAASLPNPHDMLRVRNVNPDGSNAWMGDVYRLIPFVSTFLQSFRFACTNIDPWQMVMWRGVRSEVEQRNVRDIAELSYADIINQKDAMNFRPFSEILTDYRNDHHRLS